MALAFCLVFMYFHSFFNLPPRGTPVSHEFLIKLRNLWKSGKKLVTSLIITIIVIVINKINEVTLMI